MKTTTYLLLGSNLGDRLAHLQKAGEKLVESNQLSLLAQSSVYCSEAAEVIGRQPDFLNQVLQVGCEVGEFELLDLCEMIERDLGRTTKGQKAPRLIDIDLLLFGERIIDSQRLTLPHPRLTERAFALTPLLELQPQLVHPKTKLPLADYLSKCDSTQVSVYQREGVEYVAP